MKTSDESSDGALLRPLREIDDTDAPPPAYDVSQAMRRGDAIRRRHSVTVLVAVAVVAAAIGVPLGLQPGHHAAPVPTVSPPPAIPVPTMDTPVPDITSPAELPLASCTVATLTAPPAAGAFSTWVGGSLDPTGHYLAATLIKPFTTPLTDYRPAKALLMDLHSGRMTLIPVSEGGVAGVNSSGVVIGWSGPQYAGWVYRNGKVTTLPRYHGVAGDPWAINTHGDIVGQVTIGKTQTSVIWPAGNPGAVRELAPPGFLASSITDDGRVGGSYHNQPYVGDANGNGHTLGTGARNPIGDVFGMRGDYAVGRGLSNITIGFVPMVWNVVTGVRTQYANVSLTAIASDGTVAGATAIEPDESRFYGLIGHHGVLERLPVDASPNLAVGVNDITADGHTIFGNRHTSVGTNGPIAEVGLLWHC